MLSSQILTLLEAWLMLLNTFHWVFNILFLLSVLNILIKKFSPYSQLYIAGFCIVQVSWNGCPISGFVNIFNQIGNYEFELNGFFWGFAGEWTPLVRILVLLLCGLLLWTSFETWNKSDTPVDFHNYIRKGTFKMGA